MKDFRDKSKEYVGEEFKNCFHDFYVTVLDRAEKHLHPNKNSQEWKTFRYEILNIGNSYLREVDAILSDYTVEYRPAILTIQTNGEEVPKGKEVSFIFNLLNGQLSHKSPKIPSFTMVMAKDDVNKAILEDIAELLQCGVILDTNKTLQLYVEGMHDIFNKVIPVFSSSCPFRGSTLERFNEWKEKVYQLEAGEGNVKKTT